MNAGVAPSATGITPLGAMMPFAPALAVTVQPVIEKFVWLESEPTLPEPSNARTRTRAVLVRFTGTDQLNEPEFAMPVAIAVGNVAPPSVDSARSTEATTTLSVAVQVIGCDVPAAQLSPPAGDVSETSGACVSGVPRMVSVWPFDVPPPGVGVNTVIVFVPPPPWSEARIVAVSWFTDTNEVARSEPSMRTIEQVLKLEPFTVSGNCGSPAARVLGTMDVVAGNGFVLATTKLFALDCCAFVITICTSEALMRVCVVAPVPATASTLVPPAGAVTSTSYVPLSRLPKLYCPSAFVVVLATVTAPCLSATAMPAIAVRSALVPALPSQSSVTVPNTSPYVYDSLFTQVPNVFVPLVHWPAYHAVVWPGPESEASWSMPV